MSSRSSVWSNLRPGEIWRGAWETGLAGAPEMAVLAVAGKIAGPRLLVTAGVHGDEYEGPVAIHHFLRSLTPEKLHGGVVGIAVANTPAWQARSRTNPADGVDLNRVFPGSASSDAGVTQNLAEVLFHHFVSECDMLVDLHSGGVRLLHMPMVGWYAGEAEKAEVFGRGFGAPFHPWLMPDVVGVFSYEAQRIGKLSLGAEWGGGGRLDPAGSAAYVSGLERVVARLTGQAPDDELDMLDMRSPISGSYQSTESAGIFVPSVALGERVEVGTTLGTLSDELGEVVDQPRSQRAGIVAALANVPLVGRGDRIAYIG